MTKEIMNTIYTALNTIDFEGKDAAMEAIEKELHRNDRVKAAKEEVYAEAKPVILEAIRVAGVPVTVAEIFNSYEGELPGGFTRNMISYGLNHYWTDVVEKIEGKVNSYRLKEGA